MDFENWPRSKSSRAISPREGNRPVLLRSFFPNHPDEFVVMTPLVDDVAASRLFDRTAKSLRKLFRGRLHPPPALR